MVDEWFMPVVIACISGFGVVMVTEGSLKIAEHWRRIRGTCPDGYLHWWEACIYDEGYQCRRCGTKRKAVK